MTEDERQNLQVSYNLWRVIEDDANQIVAQLSNQHSGFFWGSLSQLIKFLGINRKQCCCRCDL